MSLLVVLVAYGVLAAIAIGPPKVALALVVAVQVLVPSTFVVPNGFTSLFTLGRASLVVAALALVVRSARRRIPPGALSATPVHVAMLGFLAVAVVLGVALAAPDIPVGAQHEFFARYADAFLAFVVAVGYTRAIADPGYVLGVLVGGLVTLTALGVGEHFVGSSYGRWLLGHIDPSNFTLAARPLEQRAGEVRVRASSSFTIQYAWVMAMLIPAGWALLAVVRVRLAPVVGALLGFAALATFWSYSRSALAGVLLSTAVVVLALRLHRRLLFTLALAGAAVVVLLTVSQADAPLRAEANQDTVEIRQERIPIAVGLTAHRPALGLGLAVLEVRNLPATDNTYLLTYAEVGTIGLASLGVVFGVAAACMASGLRAPDGPDRRLAAVSCAGLAAGALGGAAFDLLANPQSTIVLFLLVGAGVATAERVRGRSLVALRRPTLARAGVVGLAVGAGFAVAAATPASGVVTTRYAFADDAGYINAPFALFVQDILINAACGAADAVDESDATFESGCTVVQADGGVVEVRIEADDLAAAQRGAAAVEAGMVDAVPEVYRFPVSETSRARPAAGTTAPASMAVVGLAVAAFAAAPPRPKDLAERANRLLLGT